MLIKNNKIGNEKIDFKMGKKKWEIENADCGKAEKKSSGGTTQLWRREPKRCIFISSMQGQHWSGESVWFVRWQPFLFTSFRFLTDFWDFVYLRQTC